jgi:DNA-binding NarL/FixJ family response regulator
MITLIIVDDHPIFRQGVADSFSLEPDIEILAQADTGEKGLTLIRSLQPQVAILDISLPGMNGLQVTRQVVAEKIPTRIILLTAYADAGQGIQGLRHGAFAFCTKDIQPDLLAGVVRKVAEGKYWIDMQEYEADDVQKIIAKQPGVEGQASSETGKIPKPLSPREMEILICLTRGMSNRDIAEKLDISHQTVKNHVTAILRKLDVDDRTQAVLVAFQYGWARSNE